MKSKQDIISALIGTVFLKEATLEEMDKEITSTSDCVVIDKDELKYAISISAKSRKIGIEISTVNGKRVSGYCTLKKFVEENEDWAEDDGNHFLENAKLLSEMLLKAIKRVERQIQKSSQQQPAS